MDEVEIAGFLSHLEIARNCSPSTQNQALNALVFLYRHVLQVDLGQLISVSWTRRKQRVPEVMTRIEVQGGLKNLESSPQKWLIACLLYGCGQRLSEALCLRVKDVDFGQGIIAIQDANGGKDRIVGDGWDIVWFLLQFRRPYEAIQLRGAT